MTPESIRAAGVFAAVVMVFAAGLSLRYEGGQRVPSVPGERGVTVAEGARMNVPMPGARP